MIREGLVKISLHDRGEHGFGQLASSLRSVEVGLGRDRYLKKIQERIEQIVKKRANQPAGTVEDADEETASELVRAERLSDLRQLLEVVQPLIEVTPSQDAAAREVIASARQFLFAVARHVNELDNNARELLLKRIKKLEKSILLSDEPVSLDVWDWLASLPDDERVLGSGPRPGCLHVDHLGSGGHSGRPYTFLVGLDDGRDPGASVQDPILLDAERGRLSRGRSEENVLPTSAARLEAEHLGFARLLTRLRGHVTLSYSCRDLTDDREMFPSPNLLDVFRLVSGKPEGNLSDLVQWRPVPVSFAPERADQCRDETEWWLWRLCSLDSK